MMSDLKLCTARARSKGDGVPFASSHIHACRTPLDGAHQTTPDPRHLCVFCRDAFAVTLSDVDGDLPDPFAPISLIRLIEAENLAVDVDKRVDTVRAITNRRFEALADTLVRLTARLDEGGERFRRLDETIDVIERRLDAHDHNLSLVLNPESLRGSVTTSTSQGVAEDPEALERPSADDTEGAWSMSTADPTPRKWLPGGHRDQVAFTKVGENAVGNGLYVGPKDPPKPRAARYGSDHLQPSATHDGCNPLWCNVAREKGFAAILASAPTAEEMLARYNAEQEDLRWAHDVLGEMLDAINRNRTELGGTAAVGLMNAQIKVARTIIRAVMGGPSTDDAERTT